MSINYWVRWFDIARNMWGLLDTSHSALTYNEYLENKPYFCLGLLSNLADILRPVHSGSIVLVIFDSFSPSQDGIPLGALGDTMVPKLFKVTSKCLLISCICWFALVRNIWGFLSTPRTLITANEILANKKYFCLGFKPTWQIS